MTGSGNGALFAAATLVLAVAAALGLAEAALEAADYPPSSFSPWIRMDDTGYGYAPSLQTRMRMPGEYDVAFETNVDGFRDDEFGPKKGARIVLLGDSFASGYGVERSRVFAGEFQEGHGLRQMGGSLAVGCCWLLAEQRSHMNTLF